MENFVDEAPCILEILYTQYFKIKRDFSIFIIACISECIRPFWQIDYSVTFSYCMHTFLMHVYNVVMAYRDIARGQQRSKIVYKIT